MKLRARTERAVQIEDPVAAQPFFPITPIHHSQPQPLCLKSLASQCLIGELAVEDLNEGNRISCLKCPSSRGSIQRCEFGDEPVNRGFDEPWSGETWYGWFSQCGFQIQLEKRHLVIGSSVVRAGDASNSCQPNKHPATAAEDQRWGVDALPAQDCAVMSDLDVNILDINSNVRPRTDDLLHDSIVVNLMKEFVTYMCGPGLSVEERQQSAQHIGCSSYNCVLPGTYVAKEKVVRRQMRKQLYVEFECAKAIENITEFITLNRSQLLNEHSSQALVMISKYKPPGVSLVSFERFSQQALLTAPLQPPRTCATSRPSSFVFAIVSHEHTHPTNNHPSSHYPSLLELFRISTYSFKSTLLAPHPTLASNLPPPQTGGV
ncbi:hypothetical protein BLNAU_7649 [Blattamonas nauphoetae]|uniref:Uncharacterized protein n=1 Tax=Blattamonas nauphoetae TaxID=2049346 RepID=A0ABQ9Y178_9EUKA|nr:hypothetical protein BLNAU_7649 [Blattamonas nauphoetae]